MKVAMIPVFLIMGSLMGCSQSSDVSTASSGDVEKRIRPVGEISMAPTTSPVEPATTVPASVPGNSPR